LTTLLRYVKIFYLAIAFVCNVQNRVDRAIFISHFLSTRPTFITRTPSPDDNDTGTVRPTVPHILSAVTGDSDWKHAQLKAA